jgi:hypothetical protein
VSLCTRKRIEFTHRSILHTELGEHTRLQHHKLETTTCLYFRPPSAAHPKLSTPPTTTTTTPLHGQSSLKPSGHCNVASPLQPLLPHQNVTCSKCPLAPYDAECTLTLHSTPLHSTDQEYPTRTCPDMLPHILSPASRQPTTSIMSP